MNQFSLSLRPLKNDRIQLKKRAGAIALSLMLLTLITTNVDAQQSLQLGVKAGANFFKVGGRSFDGKVKPGFSGGAYGELNFTSRWALQPELLFNQTIAKTSADFNSIYGGVSYQQVSLNYISLPILLVFKPVPELSILIGPQYGYLVSQTTGLLLNQQDKDKDAFKKNDISLVFGGQLNLGKVKIGLRYSAGLNDISFRSTDSWRQYGFQAYLGYQLKDIKLKKKK
jgi:hypothetical protein